jgi:catechol-2,3-dioxygenase
MLAGRLGEEPWVQLSIQMSLLNVRDLERSLGFYQDVFGLRVASRDNRVAVLMISEAERQQVLVLREEGGPQAIHMGRGGIGPRVLALEAGSPAELDAIGQRLAEREALIGRRRTASWESIVGVDPDRIQVAVSASLTGAPIQSEQWSQLDEMAYIVGE